MTEKQSEQGPLKGLLFALGAFAILSLHDVLVKVLADYSVFQVIFFAMLFGYVPFSLARLVDKRSIVLRPVHPFLVVLRGFLTVGGLSFAFLGFSLLPMVEVYVLLFTTPLIISLLAIPILGEKIHVFRWMTILLGLVGVVIVLRPTPESLEFGHLCALLSACCGGGAAIISRKIGHLENAATLILIPMILNILLAGSILYFVYKPMPLADLGLMFLLGSMALLGQLMLLYGYRNAPAALAAPMQYSQLIWAILYGAVFFDEAVDRWIILGAVITVISGLLMVWRETKVSKIQPILRTRNVRMVSAALVPGSESDEGKR
uniref:S-adenosylmethionine uptake transporter n=1 Tax=uncultured Thiotrichaceae bacterium TaxID=298394 RepID=A0A6S6TB91_9GAMM|nr:MAG: S-adenosylmethionine uptake transporter [uncultured Thiotrichaceae bacterium]